MSTFDIESTAASQGSRSHTSASSKTSKTSKDSHEVTKWHFTPRTCQLAVASKAHVRTRVIYHPNGPFNPVNGRMLRMDFAWTTVKDNTLQCPTDSVWNPVTPPEWHWNPQE
jgi:hypothetical protein